MYGECIAIQVSVSISFPQSLSLAVSLSLSLSRVSERAAKSACMKENAHGREKI